MGGSSAEEFPLLSALGLYAADIRGDGNCLFNALSDQLYGHQGEHTNIRSRVIAYMRQHAAYYKQFIDVHPGGGIRRNPKRKNAGTYSSPATYTPPSAADVDRVFESHLHSMAKGGTYGDNMEITAFSSAFDVDVKIYQRDFAYMVSARDDDEAVRPTAHIAYHLWEHYSSIRNVDGPHSGLPTVAPKVLSQQEEEQQKEKLANTPYAVQNWQVDALWKSLSNSMQYLHDRADVRRALEACKGNMDSAWERLAGAETESNSSQPESSSVERDADSDDDAHAGPNKKRDRRLSRATKAQHQGPHALSNLTTYDASQESLGSPDSETSSMPDSSQASIPAHSSHADDDEISVTHARPAHPAPKIKLLPPRPPHANSPPSGKTQQRQAGPRMSARDRKDMQKLAQKAARKKRHLADAVRSARAESPSASGLALRRAGLTETPPLETLRTLYI